MTFMKWTSKPVCFIGCTRVLTALPGCDKPSSGPPLAPSSRHQITQLPAYLPARLEVLCSKGSGAGPGRQAELGQAPLWSLPRPPQSVRAKVSGLCLLTHAGAGVNQSLGDVAVPLSLEHLNQTTPSGPRPCPSPFLQLDFLSCCPVPPDGRTWYQPPPSCPKGFCRGALPQARGSEVIIKGEET